MSEDCPECRLAIGTGIVLNICKTFLPREKCEELYGKLENGELSERQIIEIVNEQAEKTSNRDVLVKIKEVKRLIKH